MSRQLFLMSFILIIQSGCSQFHTGRSFLTQMEHDDSRFFNPQEDFPIVAGDTGRYWNSEEDFRARTPASEEEMTADLMGQTLKQELAQLEGLQTEENQEVYFKHRHKFQNISEKIYYLKLPSHERKDYLMDRGFIARPRNEFYTKHDRSLAIRSQDILLGMKKDEVLESWGKPQRVDIAGNPRHENERWLYQMNGTPKYIYFEAGEVQGWE